MNKTKILASIAFAAILSACGSDNGSLPELANNNSGSISPFDTLVVKFKSDLVDLDKLELNSNIVIDHGEIVYGKTICKEKKTTGKELCFIGTNKTAGRSHYFDYGKLNSIVFKKLKNADGYVKDSIVFNFYTYTILDTEPNNREDTAGDIDLIGDISTGVTFAGIIDKEIGTSQDGFPSYDTDDFYKLKLKQGDIISITVSNKTTPIKARFYGSCNSQNKNECNDKIDTTTVTKKSIALIDTIKPGHLQGDDPVSKMVPFYINVFDKNINERSNPYTVTVKLIYRKS